MIAPKIAAPELEIIAIIAISITLLAATLAVTSEPHQSPEMTTNVANGKRNGLGHQLPKVVSPAILAVSVSVVVDTGAETWAVGAVVVELAAVKFSPSLTHSSYIGSPLLALRLLFIIFYFLK